MDRILLISGDMISSEETLRRRVLRFTGSRNATRMIMKRIEGARRLGQIMSCMVLPGDAADTEESDGSGWDVRVSYARRAGSERSYATAGAGQGGGRA